MALSPLDLIEMYEAVMDDEQQKRWETAYWINNLLNIQIPKDKKRIKVQDLMRPFLPQKTKYEKEEEKREFYRRFQRQRKEALKNGNRSRVDGKNSS